MRPLDSVVIETGVFGEDQERNNKVKGRLQMTPEVKINGEGKGWLSKPFSCPENERQLGRYVSASNGTLASILGIVSNFTIKDCIL